MVGHGADTYFDADDSDFSVNRNSGVHRAVDDRSVRGGRGCRVIYTNALRAPYEHVVHRNTGRFTMMTSQPIRPALPTALSIDFEQQCDGATTPFYGGAPFTAATYRSCTQRCHIVHDRDPPPLARDLHRHRVVCARRREYRFAILHRSRQWTVVREYAAQNTVTWTAPVSGAYVTQLWVRRRGSAASTTWYVDGPPWRPGDDLQRKTRRLRICP